jgi:hypothetical protein
MTGRLMFFAVGYVLGTRAGRERFVQLVGLVRSVSRREEVQTAAGMARSLLQVAIERGEGYASRRAA